MALPAIPVVIKALPKILPAAKFAYDHRDKALSLYKSIQKWRNKEVAEKLQDEGIATEKLSLEEQVSQLESKLDKRDAVIAEQAEIVAKLADDLGQLSHLAELMRKRSQWHTRTLLLILVVWFVQTVFF